MHKLIKDLYILFEKYNRTTIVLLLLLSTLFLFPALKIQKNIVIKDQLEKASTDYKNLDFLENNFEEYYRVPILFTGDIQNSKKICDILLWLESQVRNNPNLVTLNSAFHLRMVKNSTERLLYPTILPLKCENTKRIDYSPVDSSPWQDIFTSIKSKNNIIFELILQKTDIRIDHKKFNSKVISNLDNNLKKFLSSKEIDYQFYILSWASNRRYVHEGIKYTTMLNLALFFIILILFKYFFSSYKSGIILIISLIFMGIFLYGTMSLLGIPLDMLNSGLFLLLSISALQDFIFIQNKMISDNTSFSKSALSLIVPSFLTSLTTVIGFGSLYFSDIIILKRFGISAAIGATVEWILIFFFLPAFIKTFTKGSIQKNEAQKQEKLTQFSMKPIPKIFSYFLLLAFISGTYSVINPKIYEEPFGIYPDSHPFSIGLNKLIETRNWSASFDVVFLKDNKKLNKAILQKIKKMDSISKVLSFYDIEDYMLKNLPSSRKRLVEREMKMTPIYSRLKNNDAMRAIIYLQKNEVSIASKIKQEIETLCKDGEICFPTGNLMAYTQFGQKVPSALLKSFGTSLALVTTVLLLLIFFTHKKDYLPIILSAMWGPFACLTLMSILGIPFNYITCMLASIIVGITGDNAIQYLFAASSKKNTKDLDFGIKKMSSASLVIFILTSSCSLIFLFGYFKFSKDIGVILILGGALSIIGDIWILRSLRKTEPTNK